MLLQPKCLRLWTFFANWDKYWKFKPVDWDPVRQIFVATPSRLGRMQWLTSAVLLAFKVAFLTVRLIQLFSRGQMGAFVFQIFLIGPGSLAVLVDITWWLYTDDFLVVFQKLSEFCRARRREYVKGIGDEEFLPDCGRVIVSETVVGTIIPLSILILHFERPDMPIYFYSALQEYNLATVEGLPFVLLGFLEWFILWKAWYTCLLLPIFWQAFAAVPSYWLGHLRMLETRRGGTVKRISELNNPVNFHRLYQEIHILVTLANNSQSLLLYAHHACAFVTQTAANYGTLRLHSNMSFGAWVCCPILAVTGTRILLDTLFTLGGVHDHSRKVIERWHNLHGNTVAKKQGEDELVEKWIDSARSLHLDMSLFAHFKKSSGFVFVELIIDHTIDVLVM